MTAILSKISNSGRRYYFTGTITLQRAQSRRGEITAAIAECGFLPGDAHVFEDLEMAEFWAGVINDDGIGGGKWAVEVVDDAQAA